MAKQKDERKQELSGKGLTRVQIAHAAMEKAQAAFESARRRWEEAVMQEESRAGSRKEKELKKLRGTADTLRKAGLNKEADAVLKKIHDMEELEE